MQEPQPVAGPHVDPARAAKEAASVHKATGSEHPGVVAALARAFFDDPATKWYFPDDSRRLRQLERTWAFIGERDWFKHDVTYTTDGGIGAAVWIPPDHWRIGIPDQLRMTPGLISRIGLRDFPRALRGFNLMESNHPHEPPHYYLPQIGVVPEWQGKASAQRFCGRCSSAATAKRCRRTSRQPQHATAPATSETDSRSPESSGTRTGRTSGQCGESLAPADFPDWRGHHLTRG
jgi:hypothetical protein